MISTDLVLRVAICAIMLDWLLMLLFYLLISADL